MSAIPTFEEQNFSSGGFSFPLYRKGDGTGVILLHELPGLTRETVDLADYIVDGGFHVAMPLLFGKPLQSLTAGLLKSPALCIRREFNCLAAGRASPITNALRALCTTIHREQGGKGVGAVGMCFTGGFVLTMMLEPALLAPVVAQPSLPFFSACALDADAQTLQNISGRDDVSVLGLRFTEDRLSPKQRMDRLEDLFIGNCANGRPRFQRIDVPGKEHSTLTFDYEDALKGGFDTRRRVLEHLRARLS